MTEYMTEDEQVELLKSWIKQYSLVILAGMTLAVLSVTGWRYWQQRQYDITSNASAIYDEMLTMRSQSDNDGTKAQARNLIKSYPKTVYSEMAAMMLARDAAANKDYRSAAKRLNWVLDKSDNDAFRQIARLRLARVLIADKQPEQALKTLQTVEDKTFTGMIKEVEGDAYLALKQPAKARASYKDAINSLPNAEVARPVLQMKYDNLAAS